MAGTTGTRCETNMNDCASAPCGNSGTCHGDAGTFSCTCAPGFTGAACEIATATTLTAAPVSTGAIPAVLVSTAVSTDVDTSSTSGSTPPTDSSSRSHANTTASSSAAQSHAVPMTVSPASISRTIRTRTPPPAPSAASTQPADTFEYAHGIPTAVATMRRRPASTSLSSQKSTSASTASRRASAPASTASRRASAPASTASRRASAPASTASRRALAPASTASRRASAPASTASRRASAPASTASRRALAPASTASRRASAPASTASRRASAPASTASRRASAPASTASRRASAPASTASRRASAPASTEPESGNTGRNHAPVIIGAVMGGVGLLLLTMSIIVVAVILRQRTCSSTLAHYTSLRCRDREAVLPLETDSNALNSKRTAPQGSAYLENYKEQRPTRADNDYVTSPDAIPARSGILVVRNASPVPGDMGTSSRRSSELQTDLRAQSRDIRVDYPNEHHRSSSHQQSSQSRLN
ncbi:mucin-19-like [Sycon ciliatum]|uniref:mucin-19-like n=1 Tax=Sycon ciliatum TaxID=27933 RepID=UPI0031F61CC4